MEPAGHRGKNDKFFRLNKPRACKSPILLIFVFYIQPSFLVIQNFGVAKNLHGHTLIPYIQSMLVAMTKMTQFRGQTSPKSSKPPISPIFVYYIPPYFMLIQNSDICFTKKLPIRALRPQLWSRLVTTVKTSHFLCQMSPEQVNPPFCRISCAIVHRIYGDP